MAIPTNLQNLKPEIALNFNAMHAKSWMHRLMNGGSITVFVVSGSDRNKKGDPQSEGLEQLDSYLARTMYDLKHPTKAEPNHCYLNLTGK
ncbi:MAG: hypothetical protein PUP92_33105 [Rhizonema sp. PD38]|nr:hypothetical protein [Rhizonema sp. PD38]